MALTTNITMPESGVRQGAFRSAWINSSFLDDQTFRKMFNQAGNVPLMVDFLDKPESKIYIANQDMDIYEKQYPEMALLLAADITAGAAGATINAVVDSSQITGGKHAFRVGKSLFVPAEYMPAGVVIPQEYIIESLATTNSANDTCVCRPVNATGTYSTAAQITSTIPAGEYLSLGAGASGPETGQPEGLTYSWAKKTFSPRVIKETGKLGVGVAAKQWLEPIKLDLIGGGEGILSRIRVDLEKRLRKQSDLSFIAGQRDDNAALVATSDFGDSNLIKSSDGIGHLAAQYAQNVIMPSSGDIVIDDFDNLAEVWESVGMEARNAIAYMSPVVNRMLQRSGLDIIKDYSGGSDLLNREKTRLGITLQGITRGGINYTFYPLATLTDPAGLGAKKSNGTYMYPQYAEMMLIVPEMDIEMKMAGSYANYSSGERYSAGTVGKFPNMFLGVIENNGESLERWGGIYEGPNGFSGPDGKVSTDKAKIEVYHNTSIMLIWGEINKCIYVRRKH